MKTLLTTLALAAFALQLHASGDAWTTDLPAAKDTAKKENKLILMDFTGSDWCPPCVALKKQVFETDIRPGGMMRRGRR